MRLHSLLQHVDDLTGTQARRVSHQFQQTLVAKQFLIGILGLVQSVGVDQQLFAADILNGIAFEGVVFPKA